MTSMVADGLRLKTTADLMERFFGNALLVLLLFFFFVAVSAPFSLIFSAELIN